MASKKNKEARKEAKATPVTQATMDKITSALAQSTLNDNQPTSAPSVSRYIPCLNRDNIAEEFDRYFGNVGKLDNWQRLCRDVGIEGNLRTVTQCRKVGMMFSASSCNP